MLCMVLRVSRLQKYPLDSPRLPSAGHQRKLERGSIRVLVVVQTGCVLDGCVAYLHYCMHSVDMRSNQISCTCPRYRIFCLFPETFAPLRSRCWRDNGRT